MIYNQEQIEERYNEFGGKTMYQTLLSLLACPQDPGSPLELAGRVVEIDGEIVSGELNCVTCRCKYPIEDGIPDLCELGPESVDLRRKRAEIAARDSEASGSYDRQFTTYDVAVEKNAILRRLDLKPAHRVLELGCGTGRLSLPVLEHCGEFVGVDFSFQFLRTLRRRLGSRRDAHIIRADVTHLPLRRGPLFDRVLSAQVLEHLPSAESRRAFATNAHSVLKEDGRLVLTTYNYSWVLRHLGELREGYHPLGIYYYRYQASELEKELRRWYRVREICGIRNQLIPGKVLLSLGTAGVLLDDLIARMYFSRSLGRLLLCVCVPNHQP